MFAERARRREPVPGKGTTRDSSGGHHLRENQDRIPGGTRELASVKKALGRPWSSSKLD